MESSDLSRNRHNDHLGVNKIGKNIRKSPLHQPNFTNTDRQQPQPQIYNINKNDFRNIVQQLTGSPSLEPLPRPPHNPPKPASMRLQRIRPPPLTPINRGLQNPIHHQQPVHHPQPPPLPPQVPEAPLGNNFVRPAQFGPPSPKMFPPNSVWPNAAQSPISAYMSYLQNSIIDSSPQAQSQIHPHQQLQFSQPLASGPPRMNGPPSPLLPSPTSQFLLSSPTSFLNLLSPRSPYPLLSPGYQHPPPWTPNFSFSPMAQSGILGSGPPPPLSPGLGFPSSPSGFFALPSPRWREQ